MKKLTIIYFAIVLIIIIRTANAGFTTYFDRSSFTSNISGTSTIEDFTQDEHRPILSGIINSSSTEEGLTPGDIEPGATYSITNTILSPSFGIYKVSSLNFSGGHLRGLGTLEVTFDSPVSFFGFDTTYDLMISANIQIIDQNDNDIYNQFTVITDDSDNPNAIQFFGIESNMANIKSIYIDGYRNSFDLDNFTFSSANQMPVVPVPGALALGYTGCAILLCMRKRNKT